MLKGLILTILLSVVAAQPVLASSSVVARSGMKIVVNEPHLGHPRVGYIKDVFMNGQVNVALPGYSSQPMVFSLAESGVEVQCLYNDQVCVGHRAVVKRSFDTTSLVGTITGVFSNGFVSVKIDNGYSSADLIVSLREIGVQADCAVISCEFKPRQ